MMNEISAVAPSRRSSPPRLKSKTYMIPKRERDLLIARIMTIESRRLVIVKDKQPRNRLEAGIDAIETWGD